MRKEDIQSEEDNDKEQKDDNGTPDEEAYEVERKANQDAQDVADDDNARLEEIYQTKDKEVILQFSRYTNRRKLT